MVRHLLRSFKSRTATSPQQTSNEAASRVINNLESCVRSAEQIVSSAATIVSARSIGDSQRDSILEEVGGMLSEPQINRTKTWVLAVTEGSNNDFPVARSNSLSNSQYGIPSIMDTPSLMNAPSGTEALHDFSSDTQATASVTSENEPIARLRLDNLHPDLEIQLVEHWRKSAAEKLRAKEYVKAEQMLHKILKRSEAAFGDQFDWRSETISMLATVYCELRQWDKAQDLLREQFSGKDAMMVKFVVGCCRLTDMEKPDRWDKTEMILNEKFEGKEEAIKVLLIEFCQRGRWADAKKIFCYPFDEKDSTMVMLATEFCEKKKWDHAENILYFEFEGKDKLLLTVVTHLTRAAQWKNTERLAHSQIKGRVKVMEVLALSYVQHQKLDEAETLLLELCNSHGEDDLQKLGAMHLLASVKLRKAEFEVAEHWCIRAMNGRKLILGQQHVLFYVSLNLLSRIYEEQGDLVESEGYKSLLPPDFERIFLLVSKLIEACEQIELLCTMNHSQVLECIDERRVLPRDNKWWGEIRAHGSQLIGSGSTELIHLYAFHGMPMAVELLLEKGADLNARSHFNMTPLYLAAREGKIATVKLLLERGADIEARCNSAYNYTPLMAAAYWGHESTVELLLKTGANIEPREIYGNTAVHLARSKGHKRVVRLLEEAERVRLLRKLQSSFLKRWR